MRMRTATTNTSRLWREPRGARSAKRGRLCSRPRFALRAPHVIRLAFLFVLLAFLLALLRSFLRAFSMPRVHFRLGHHRAWREHTAFAHAGEHLEALEDA